MRITEYSKIYLFKPGTHYKCRRCRSTDKVPGDTYVAREKEMTDIAVDGTEARYVVWRCRLCGQLQNRGWNKPVDFTYGKGQDEYVEPEAIDMTAHYEQKMREMEMEQRRLKNRSVLTRPRS